MKDLARLSGYAGSSECSLDAYTNALIQKSHIFKEQFTFITNLPAQKYEVGYTKQSNSLASITLNLSNEIQIDIKLTFWVTNCEKLLQGKSYLYLQPKYKCIKPVNPNFHYNKLTFAILTIVLLLGNLPSLLPLMS